MLNRIFKSVLLGVFALVLCTTITSCNKEKETIGVIIVKYSNGNLVNGANVRLYPDSSVNIGNNLSNPDLDKTNHTDANGRAEFTYALPAILNIYVVDTVGNDIYVGEDIIRLLKGKIVTKVVEIN